MSEQTAEERESQYEELAAERAELVVPNDPNQYEAAHQRWLETGQTEPEFMYPSEDEAEEDEGDEE